MSIVDIRQGGVPFPILKAPFPWFGGKSRVAPAVWERFGDVANYVEPFAGSLAVLLGRPGFSGTETVNDLDCFLSNFWRSISIDPEATAAACDWPVNEADLHARHLWLVSQEEFRGRMKTDPEYFDTKIAGWWVWGISQWIGSGWCSRSDWTGRTNAGRAPRGIFRELPYLGGGHGGQGRGVTTERVSGPTRQLPSLRGDSGAAGQGIFSSRVSGTQRKRPMIHGGHTGKGVHAENPGVSSHFGDAGMGVSRQLPGLFAYFEALATRLRRVRVCCGDWTRVLGPSVTVKHGVCGIFLDPPYDMRVVSSTNSGRDGAAPSDGLYANHDNDLSRVVREWAIDNGDNPLLRIALCGYESEHEFPNSWECVAWKAHGGYGSQRGDQGYENSKRERIWFSPHCLSGKQASLFRDTSLSATGQAE